MKNPAQELADGIASAMVIAELIEDSPPAQLVLMLSVLRSALRQLNDQAQALAGTTTDEPKGQRGKA